MKLLTMRFRTWCNNSERWGDLHKKAMRRYWNIPENVRKIWLVVHSCPASDRVAVRVKWNLITDRITSTPAFRFWYPDLNPNSSVGCYSEYVIRTLKMRRLRMVARTVYVECWYEEGGGG